MLQPVACKPQAVAVCCRLVAGVRLRAAGVLQAHGRRAAGVLQAGGRRATSNWKASGKRALQAHIPCRDFSSSVGHTVLRLHTLFKLLI